MPRLNLYLTEKRSDRLNLLAEQLNEKPHEVVKALIDQATWALNSNHIGTISAPYSNQTAPNPSRRRASSPSGKNKNNNITNSLSKTPTPKSGKNSDKDAGEPKAEKETPPRLTHKFFVGLLDTFGEEHPEYLTEAVKAAWSKFVTHRQGLGTNKTFGTKTGALGVLSKMHKLSSKMEEPTAHAEKLLRVATERRWMTLYEPKEEEKIGDAEEALWNADPRRNYEM
jgi:hypothetical protein